MIHKVKRPSMWEQTKKSPQVKMLILIVLVVSFIPFSCLWYSQLTSFKCIESSIVHIHKTNSGTQNCTQQAGMHWAIFYGINGMIYGVPLMTVALSSKRK
ncbi:MAG: hypothetical protein WCC55_00795 [Nitrosotalea sp.]